MRIKFYATLVYFYEELTNIVIGNGQFGKPYIVGKSDFHYNISHSEDYVVCVVDTMPIGIDIEKVVSIDYKLISQKYFSKSEVEYLYSNNNKSELTKFYEVWTLKESLVKYFGFGLQFPLNSFDALGQKKINEDSLNESFSNVYSKNHEIEKDYIIGISSHRSVNSIRLVEFNILSIIDKLLTK